MRAVVVRASNLTVLQLLLITSTRQISRWTNPYLRFAEIPFLYFCALRGRRYSLKNQSRTEARLHTLRPLDPIYNNLLYNKLREAEGTPGIIPIRHEKARRGRSVLLSWFHDVTSSAARKGIVKRCVVSLFDASLAVDAVVADWLLVDHPSRKDTSKAVLVVFLSRSCRMSRSEFFCSCRNGIFHDISRQRKLYKNSGKCSTRHFYVNVQDAKVSSRHEK